MSVPLSGLRFFFSTEPDCVQTAQNGGNPGITFFRDQLGCNAHSFDDILIYDAAVTGCAEEHAAAEAAVAALPASAIRVGFPQEFFVDYNIPASVREHETINKKTQENDFKVIPTPSHVLGRISPIFPPLFPVVCAFSPSRRGGSNEPNRRPS